MRAIITPYTLKAIYATRHLLPFPVAAIGSRLDL